MPESPVDAGADQAPAPQFAVVNLEGADQEEQKSGQDQQQPQGEERMGRENKVDQRGGVRVFAQGLDMHDRAVEKAGEGQQHPERLQDDEKGGDPEKDIRRLGPGWVFLVSWRHGNP